MNRTDPSTWLDIDQFCSREVICGVYAIYDTLGKLWYIGQSQDIQIRLRTNPVCDAIPNSTVRYFVCDDRIELEAQLIYELQPELNRRIPKWPRIQSKYQYFRLPDHSGDLRELIDLAVEEYRYTLIDDEATPEGLMRLIVKNLPACIRAIKGL